MAAFEQGALALFGGTGDFNLGLGFIGLRVGGCDLRGQRAGIQPRQRIAGFDPVADVDSNFGNPATALKSEIAFPPRGDQTRIGLADRCVLAVIDGEHAHGYRIGLALPDVGIRGPRRRYENHDCGNAQRRHEDGHPCTD